MKVFHATPKSNLDSIKQNGLLVSKAKKSCKFVWLHTPSRSHWAILHTSQNHGADWDDVVIIEIDVPRSWIKANKLTIRGKGLNGFWKCDRDISPDRFTAIRDSLEYAMSR